MRTVALVIAISIGIVACAVDADTTSTAQPICTQEDIDNGTCGDPGGGSPQDLQDETIGYANTIINLYPGYEVVPDYISLTCWYENNTHTCMMIVDIYGQYSFHVRAVCNKFPNGQVVCESRG